jgi:hypothetical protein
MGARIDHPPAEERRGATETQNHQMGGQAMKAIKDMNLAELANLIEHDTYVEWQVIDRLRELHELTRWIPVSERMPTEEDGKWVQARVGKHLPCVTPVEDFTRFNDAFTHWQRITSPEAP